MNQSGNKRVRLDSLGYNRLFPPGYLKRYAALALRDAMKAFWRPFAFWFSVVAAIWVFANLPRDAGSLKPWLASAGFPWAFATWEHDNMQRVSALILVADIATGLIVAILLATLAASARCLHANSRQTI